MISKRCSSERKIQENLCCIPANALFSSFSIGVPVRYGVLPNSPLSLACTCSKARACLAHPLCVTRRHLHHVFLAGCTLDRLWLKPPPPHPFEPKLGKPSSAQRHRALRLFALVTKACMDTKKRFKTLHACVWQVALAAAREEARTAKAHAEALQVTEGRAPQDAGELGEKA